MPSTRGMRSLRMRMKGKLLSSRSRMLYRGWCSLIREFSSSSASNSVGTMDHAQVHDLAHQQVGLAVRVVLGEVAAHPVSQVLGLAHVQDLAVGIEELVHPGAMGQQFHFLADVELAHGSAKFGMKRGG